MRWNRIACGAAALAVLVGGLSGCGDDDKAEALTVKASSSGGKFAFDMPKEIDGGLVALTLDNTDQRAPRDRAGARAGRHLPDEAHQGAAGQRRRRADPGLHQRHRRRRLRRTRARAVTATQELAEGTYVYFCTFGDGDAVHYKNGMLGTVRSRTTRARATCPTAPSRSPASEYKFDVKDLAGRARTSCCSRTTATSSTTPSSSRSTRAAPSTT